MGLASLYNVPSTDNEMDDWAFAHQANHRDINRVISQVFNLQLPEYVLDPINQREIEVWLYQHQLLHQAMDDILGISGYDLLDVNWQDPNDRAGWILLNGTEHRAACDELGLG